MLPVLDVAVAVSGFDNAMELYSATGPSAYVRRTSSKTFPLEEDTTFPTSPTRWPMHDFI